MIIWYCKIKASLNQGLGRGGVAMIIAGFVLLAAYMMYPEVFHNFFQFVREQFFQSVDSSFKEDPFGNNGGAKGGGK